MVTELAMDCHRGGSSRFSREEPQASLILMRLQGGGDRAEVVLHIPDFSRLKHSSFLGFFESMGMGRICCHLSEVTPLPSSRLVLSGGKCSSLSAEGTCETCQMRCEMLGILIVRNISNAVT